MSDSQDRETLGESDMLKAFTESLANAADLDPPGQLNSGMSEIYLSLLAMHSNAQRHYLKGLIMELTLQRKCIDSLQKQMRMVLDAFVIISDRLEKMGDEKLPPFDLDQFSRN